MSDKAPLAGIFTGFVDVPLDYKSMMQNLAGMIRRKNYDKGVSYREKGIEFMREQTKEEMKELEGEFDEFRGWEFVEREALHLSLSALLVSQLAREKAARS